MKHISHDIRLLRDWKIILSMFVLLVTCVAAFHGYFFYQLNRGGLFVVSGEARDESIVQQKKAVREVNNMFEVRGQPADPVPVVDPSL